jgi:hypothetical protein
MSAQAAWSQADRNRGYRRQLHEIDRRQRSFSGVSYVCKEMKPGTQKRRAQFECNLSESETGEKDQKEDEADVNSTFHVNGGIICGES